MAVKDPGIDNAAPNRRVNRYTYGLNPEPNRADRRHKQVGRATTIGFTNPDTITDSGNGLGVFEDDEGISLVGSTSNDGEYRADSVVAGSIECVEQTIVLEAAGDSILIRSLNNRVDSRFA